MAPKEDLSWMLLSYQLYSSLPWRPPWCSTLGWGCSGWGLWTGLLPSPVCSTWCCSGRGSCDSGRCLRSCTVLQPSRPALSPVRERGHVEIITAPSLLSDLNKNVCRCMMEIGGWWLTDKMWAATSKMAFPGKSVCFSKGHSSHWGSFTNHSSSTADTSCVRCCRQPGLYLSVNLQLLSCWWFHLQTCLQTLL